jgi:hypothetical protein
MSLLSFAESEGQGHGQHPVEVVATLDEMRSRLRTGVSVRARGLFERLLRIPENDRRLV